jgi:tRNA(adenine34) deaminase
MADPQEIHAARWEAAMRQALAEADKAEAAGDVPIGAVIVDSEDGHVVAAAHNRRIIDADPTAHAEMLAIRAASEAIGDWRLGGCTLAVTLEPCVMCAGAIVLARLDRVVYGPTDPKAGAVETLYGVCTDERLNHRVEVVGGVLAAEGAERLRSFFRRQRAAGKK